MNTIQPHKLNKRERKAQQLLAHYATCERLAVALGMPPDKVDGKKISVALLKLEILANKGATFCCNGENFLPAEQMRHSPYQFHHDENAWDTFAKDIGDKLESIFGKLPQEFFVNGDARGYALKIDNENPAGKALIESCELHTDMGGYGILSPKINGN